MIDHSTKPYQLERRPSKQGLRPLSNIRGRVEKLTTGNTSNTNCTTKNTHKLKLIKKHSDSGNLEGADTMGSWITGTA
jgi:hypothetical protein